MRIEKQATAVCGSVEIEHPGYGIGDAIKGALAYALSSEQLSSMKRRTEVWSVTV
jgi:hypothetical protein